MRTFIMVVAILVLFSLSAEAKRFMVEDEYVKMTCAGEVEHHNSDGTWTDCLMVTYAVEYDFADKWAECVGQALHYSRMTNYPPMCVLIIEQGKDCKHIRKAVGLGVRVLTLDFNQLCEWEGIWGNVKSPVKRN